MKNHMKDFPIDKAVELLKVEVRDYDVPVVDLVAAQSKDPFKILVATILSARTKDEVTAAACRRLFKRMGEPEDLERIPTRELEKIMIARVLAKTGGNRSQASRLLEISHPSLLSKMKQYGLT